VRAVGVTVFLWVDCASVTSGGVIITLHSSGSDSGDVDRLRGRNDYAKCGRDKVRKLVSRPYSTCTTPRNSNTPGRREMPTTVHNFLNRQDLFLYGRRPIRVVCRALRWLPAVAAFCRPNERQKRKVHVRPNCMLSKGGIAPLALISRNHRSDPEGHQRDHSRGSPQLGGTSPPPNYRVNNEGESGVEPYSLCGCPGGGKSQTKERRMRWNRGFLFGPGSSDRVGPARKRPEHNALTLQLGYEPVLPSRKLLSLLRIEICGQAHSSPSATTV